MISIPVIDRTIAIVGGAGAEGRALGLRFVAAGGHVRIGSRDIERAKSASRVIAARTGVESVEGFDNQEAVRGADIVVLTVPPEAQVESLETLRSSWKAGAVVIDVTVRLKSTENSAQIAAQHVPATVSVASAFHTLSSDLLSQIDQPVDSDVLICAQNAEAKATAAGIAGLLRGARAVDAGGLSNSRLIENAVQLLIALNRSNKCKHAGVRITGI